MRGRSAVGSRFVGTSRSYGKTALAAICLVAAGNAKP
jgi:hypothetical protein